MNSIFEQTSSTFERTSSTFEGTSSTFEWTSSTFEQKHFTFERTNSTFERTSSTFERMNSAFLNPNLTFEIGVRDRHSRSEFKIGVRHFTGVGRTYVYAVQMSNSDLELRSRMSISYSDLECRTNYNAAQVLSYKNEKILDLSSLAEPRRLTFSGEARTQLPGQDIKNCNS